MNADCGTRRPSSSHAPDHLEWIAWRWTAIALTWALASVAGYGLFQDSSPDTVASALALAAGAVLTILADTVMLEAYARGGKVVGVVTTLGFAFLHAVA